LRRDARSLFLQNEELSLRTTALSIDPLNEGRAVRAVAWVYFLVLCLGLTGCTLLGKKSNAKQNLPSGPAPTAGAPAPVDPSIPTSTVPVGSGGILAGRVIDSYEHRPPRTYIQVVSGSDGKGPKGAPIEVETDSQGFFTIPGLQPGQHYQLIARTRDNSPRLAGTTWATPPNPRLLIYISEDFASPNTPAAPAPPTFPGQKSGAGGDQRDPAKPPSSNVPPQRAADIGSPLRGNDSGSGQEVSPTSSPPAEPSPGVRTQDVVVEPNGYARNEPVLSVAPQGETPASPLSPQIAPLPPPVPALATRVPSCVLTGRQLDNFALNDLTGRPWEYRNNRSRLMLIDFWGTWCIPCRQSIPHLNILQNNYGPYGFKVVGIAYERETLAQQIRKVQDVRDHLGISYQLLLGSDMETCPVRTQFGVSKYPTLVLIDANSRIIWRSEGLDTEKLQELDALIKQQLRGQ
jgi:thiol-disulfide isomerase/thioredoxin